MRDLKTIRLEKKLTQKEAAERLGVSLRSYVTYENDESRSGTSKYRFLLHELSALDPVDEEHGILSIEDIIKKCADVFQDYNVAICSVLMQKVKPGSRVMSTFLYQLIQRG